MNNKAITLTISETIETQPLSTIQRKFNATLAKIEKQKKALADWTSAHETCQKMLVTKYEPLRQKLMNERIQFALMLDQHLNTHKFTKTQQQKIIYILNELFDHLSDSNVDDPDFIALQTRYQQDEEELDSEEIQEMEAMMRQTFEDVFGIKLDEDDDINDSELLARKIFEREQAYHEQQQAQQKAKQQRKKTTKQQEKEAKELAEAQQTQHSIQTIYRQLVKNLHPDREADPTERERKNLLMQTITVAYEEQNLIRLLELQQQEMSQQDLRHLADDQLKSFIRLFEKQLQEIKQQTVDLEHHYKELLGMGIGQQLNPNKLNNLLKREAIELEMQIHRSVVQRQHFTQDIQSFKSWLKMYSIVDDDWD